MTYVTTPRQLSKTQDPTSTMQSLNDDIRALDSVAVPFQSVLYELTFISGRAVRVTPQFKPYGASLMSTSGAEVTSFKSELRGTNAIEITVTMPTAAPAKLLFLIIGELREVRK